MRIRAITYFFNPGQKISAIELKAAGQFIKTARSAFQDAGFEVQSTRIATIPFTKLTSPSKLASYAPNLENAVKLEGFEYLNLGPAFPDQIDSYSAIPSGLAATQNTFFSGMITHQTSPHSRKMSLRAIRACAQVIIDTAPILPDGFANLRFAALANVRSNCPFFQLLTIHTMHLRLLLRSRLQSWRQVLLQMPHPSATPENNWSAVSKAMRPDWKKLPIEWLGKP